MTLLNKNQLAVAMGISIHDVDKWLRQGCPAAVQGDKKRAWGFDLEAVKEWAASCGVSGGNRPSMDEEKLRKLTAEADKIELELAKARGDLISLTDAMRVVANMVAAFRQRVLSIPSKVGPIVAAEDDAVVVRELIERECIEALEELANYDPGNLDPEGSLEELPGSAGVSGECGETAAATDDQPMGRPVPQAQPRKQRKPRSMAN